MKFVHIRKAEDGFPSGYIFCYRLDYGGRAEFKERCQYRHGNVHCKATDLQTRSRRNECTKEVRNCWMMLFLLRPTRNDE
jgi:hypothetical protein